MMSIKRYFYLTCCVIAFGFADAVVSEVSAQEQAAVETLSKADIRARFEQAEALRAGYGVERDITRSIELHSELADLGHARSLARLGRIYAEGDGVPQDVELGLAFLEKAAAAGREYSLYRIGRVLEKEGRGAEALAAYQRASDAGVEAAALGIALGHMKGTFGDASDLEAGFALLSDLAETGDEKALFALGDAYRLGRGVAFDGARSFEIFSRLAEADIARAHYRLGYHHARGVGTPQDPEAALAAYQKSAQLGYDRALKDVGELQLETGRAAEALATLTTAVERDVEGAELTLTLGHLDGGFGTASDPGKGQDRIVALAENGDVRAGLFLLEALDDRRDLGGDMGVIVAHLQNAAENGEGKAAEALVNFYRNNPDRVSCANTKRADLLAGQGESIRSKVFYREVMRHFYNRRNVTASRQQMYDVLKSADQDGFRFGLHEMQRIDRRVYTFAIQNELKQRDLYAGPLSGLMNASTVRGILRFCQANGLSDVCSHGPLRSDAVKAVAAVLSRDQKPNRGALPHAIAVPACEN